MDYWKFLSSYAQYASNGSAIMNNDETIVWREPWKLRAPAFAITDSLYYVGNRNVSCHIIRSTSGVVLIDTAFSQTTYLLTESIRSVGVDPTEIKMILHTHGHVDHCGATRRLKELTGATIAMGEQDVETVERGTALTCAEYLYGINYFETFRVDRPLKHKDSIDLGDTVIQCHHTPGHTQGVMTFIFDIQEDGERLTAGLFGGPGLWTLESEHRDKQGYPRGRRDFSETLKYLRSLDVDIWLGAHPDQNGTFDKFECLRRGERPNPFIDPVGWKHFLAKIESDFQKLLD